MSNMDYLSDKALYPIAARPGQFSAVEVRRAALALILNPNAMLARLILIEYANFQPGELITVKKRHDDEYFSAVLSLTAGRIARGIHRYDRFSHTLRGFLLNCFHHAEQDLLSKLRQPDDESGHVTGRDKRRAAVYGADTCTERFNRDAPFGRKSIDDLRGEAEISRFLQQAEGRAAFYPLREATPDKHRAAVPYVLLSISDEELDDVMRWCEAQNVPVCADMTLFARAYTLEEKRQIFERFAQWWRQRKPDAAFALDVFEQNFIFDKNENDTFDALSERWPQKTRGQVHNALYSHARKAFRQYAAEDELMARDNALSAAYQTIVQEKTSDLDT